MKFHLPVPRRGAICVPELVTDPELARGVAQNFGNRPTWVATTSKATHEALTLQSTEPVRLVARLGACRPDPSGSVGVVLAVQLGERQLRCVAPLEDVGLQRLLHHAANNGSLQVALGPHKGSRCTVFDVPMLAPNVQRVLDLPVRPVSLTEQAKAVAMTTSLCQRIDEVPSLIADRTVTAVDIAVVHVGGSPFSLDAHALARIGQDAGALFARHLQ